MFMSGSEGLVGLRFMSRSERLVGVMLMPGSEGLVGLTKGQHLRDLKTFN